MNRHGQLSCLNNPFLSLTSEGMYISKSLAYLYKLVFFSICLDPNSSVTFIHVSLFNTHNSEFIRQRLCPQVYKIQKNWTIWWKCFSFRLSSTILVKYKLIWRSLCGCTIFQWHISLFTWQTCSTKKKRVKKCQQPGWMNQEILNSIKTRDKYHNEKDVNNYKSWRNKVKSLVFKSKQEFQWCH